MGAFTTCRSLQGGSSLEMVVKCFRASCHVSGQPSGYAVDNTLIACHLVDQTLRLKYGRIEDTALTDHSPLLGRTRCQSNGHCGLTMSMSECVASEDSDAGCRCVAGSCSAHPERGVHLWVERLHGGGFAGVHLPGPGVSASSHACTDERATRPRPAAM